MQCVLPTRAWTREEEGHIGKGQFRSFPQGYTPRSYVPGWTERAGRILPITASYLSLSHPHPPPSSHHCWSPQALCMAVSSQGWLWPQESNPTSCFPPRSPHPVGHWQSWQPLPGTRCLGSARGRGQAFAALRASSCWPNPSAPAPAGLSWMGKEEESGGVCRARRKLQNSGVATMEKKMLTAPSKPQCFLSPPLQ